MMLRSTSRLVLCGGIAVAVAAVLLSLPAQAPPAAAQDEPVFFTEMRLVGPLTTYAEANASSPVKANVPSGSVVDALANSRVVGADGVLWTRVRQPDGVDLGWVKVTDLNVAAGNEPYYGFQTGATPYYNPSTGTIYNPLTGTSTPVSPYNPLTPYVP
jgi:hypothetical protein